MRAGGIRRGRRVVGENGFVCREMLTLAGEFSVLAMEETELFFEFADLLTHNRHLICWYGVTRSLSLEGHSSIRKDVLVLG